MKTLEELVKEKAKDFANDSWLSDTKDCLKETYNDHNPQSIQELVSLFEQDWEQTLHFTLQYNNPIRSLLRDKYPDKNYDFITDELLDSRSTLWNKYHEENNTYKLAKEIMGGDNYE